MLTLPRSVRTSELDGLAQLLLRDQPNRLLIAGGPRAGKSTLSTHFTNSWHLDDLMGLGWSESSLAASFWFDRPGPWVIEGVSAPRALRKWLARSEGTPADMIVYLTEPAVARSRGQHVMSLGCRTVWEEIRPELMLRGCQVLEHGLL